MGPEICPPPPLYNAGVGFELSDVHEIQPSAWACEGEVVCCHPKPRCYLRGGYLFVDGAQKVKHGPAEDGARVPVSACQKSPFRNYIQILIFHGVHQHQHRLLQYDIA